MFEGCRDLERIDLPDGVCSVGRNSFKDCVSLKTVRMPDTVRRIDPTAFDGCQDVEVEVDFFGLCAMQLRLQGIAGRTRA